MQDTTTHILPIASRLYRKFLLVFLLISLLFVCRYPCEAKGLLGDKEQVQRIIESYIEEAKAGTAAVSIAYFQQGEVLYQTAYGHLDLDSQLENSDLAIFEWGSVSKALVWVSLAQLAEQGLVDFTADIRTYLPDDFPLKLSYEEPITILNLMNHNAGFQEVSYKVEYAEGEEIPGLEKVLRDSAPPQIYQPGKVTAYSNWGAALAGLIVEKVSGQPYYEYVKEHIFQVLDMNHTALLPDWSDNAFVQEGRSATKSYYLDEENSEDYGLAISHIALYPAGACAGTFSDFVKFAQEFSKEKSKLLSNKASWDLFRTASLNYSDSDLGRIYHGLWSLDLGSKLIGHPGNTGGFSASFWFDPLSQTGLAVMTNEAGETYYNYGILQAIYGPNSSPRLEASSEETQRYVDISGLYYPLRTIHQGQARMTKYIGGLLPISREQTGYSLGMMPEAKINPLADDFYLQEMPNGLAFLNKYQEGILESFTTDYAILPLPELILAILLFIVLLVCLLFLVSRPVALLLRAKRKLTLRPYQLKAHHSLELAGVLGLTLFLSYLKFMPYKLTGISKVLIALISVGCSIPIIGNLADQIIARNKDKNSQGDLIWSAFSSLGVVAVFFFDLYQIWI